MTPSGESALPTFLFTPRPSRSDKLSVLKDGETLSGCPRIGFFVFSDKSSDNACTIVLSGISITSRISDKCSDMSSDIVRKVRTRACLGQALSELLSELFSEICQRHCQFIRNETAGAADRRDLDRAHARPDHESETAMTDPEAIAERSARPAGLPAASAGPQI
jgi:hypothetical protein